MAKKSAGILLYKLSGKEVLFFLVHPGGPFWRNKDTGAWSIPKGEFDDNENPLKAAIREFKEETGTEVSGNFIPLSPVKLKSGKLIYAWALEKDLDPSTIKSNEFEMEWPPHTGKKIWVPEVDKGDWFFFEEAKEKINPGQVNLIEECFDLLKLHLAR
ncbi:MAG: putative pyrophosphohydrolase [Bacteroidetes bacterium]|nr:putative pyrophosphohydrolase [Bacteroidota bacterium]